MFPSPALWVLALAVSQGADLQIVTDRSTRKVDGRLEGGHRYLELRDIARALDCELAEADRQTLVVSGPRGELRLTAGRTLVRTPAEDVLLSAPAWRRSRNRWWVPEDFLTRALVNVVRVRLVSDEQGYRAVELPTAHVRVAVANYPDHVSVNFASSLPIDDNVREYSDWIEVRLGQALLDAGIEGESPNPRAVGGLRFEPADGSGAIHIAKGSRFESHRVSRAGSRSLIIDLFWEPEAGRMAGSGGGAAGPLPIPDSRSLVPDFSDSESRTARSEKRPFAGVVIDPGHGGDDQGSVLGHTNEKVLTLTLASSLASRLNRRGTPARLTRRRDISLATLQRSALGNQPDGRAFVGLHFGRFSGVQVYVYGDPLATEDLGTSGPELLPWQQAYRARRFASWRLAGRLQRELDAFNPEPRRPLEAPLEILRSVRVPAVVVEVGVDDAGRPLTDGPAGSRLVEAIVRALP